MAGQAYVAAYWAILSLKLAGAKKQNVLITASMAICTFQFLLLGVYRMVATFFIQ
jgi:hypothetical protein